MARPFPVGLSPTSQYQKVRRLNQWNWALHKLSMICKVPLYSSLWGLCARRSRGEFQQVYAFSLVSDQIGNIRVRLISLIVRERWKDLYDIPGKNKISPMCRRSETVVRKIAESRAQRARVLSLMQPTPSLQNMGVIGVQFFDRPDSRSLWL